MLKVHRRWMLIPLRLGTIWLCLPIQRKLCTFNKQDLSSSCRIDIPSDEDENIHGYDTVNVNGNTNELDLNSSSEDILSGSIGIRQKPGEIAQRTARGTLRLVYEHIFDEEASAANDTATNDSSFWAEGNNNNANTSGVNDSFESVSSMVLIERRFRFLLELLLGPTLIMNKYLYWSSMKLSTLRTSFSKA